jgi:hypothetical protein
MIAQVRGNDGQPTPELPELAESQATFEHGDGLIEVPFAEVEKAGGKTGLDNIFGLIDGLGYSDLFLHMGDPLGECSQLGQ